MRNKDGWGRHLVWYMEASLPLSKYFRGQCLLNASWRQYFLCAIFRASSTSGGQLPYLSLKAWCGSILMPIWLDIWGRIAML